MRFGDICCAPGGFSDFVLKMVGSTLGRGVTLPLLESVPETAVGYANSVNSPLQFLLRIRVQVISQSASC